MRFRSLTIGPILLLLWGGNLHSQAPVFPVEPILQLEPGGPTAAVTCVAFAPGGKTLYAAGYDKVVRAWHRDAKTGKFTPRDPFRVPVGPGSDGAINTLAVSPDGRWLAAAGLGIVRELAGFRQSGILQPRIGRMSEAMLQDQGAIHLFDTTRKGKDRVLRGHLGPVLSMTFAPASPGKPALLVSMGRESEAGKENGVLRLWDASGGKQLGRSEALPDPLDGRPGLAPWHAGKNTRDVCVAVACNGQPLRVWKAATNKVELQGDKRLFNDTVAFVPNRTPYSGTLLRSFFQEPGARIQAWQVNGSAKLEPLADETPLLAEDGAPSALALRPDGSGAMVVRMRENPPPPDNEYRLVTFALGGADVKVLQGQVSLWRGKQKPALAVSSDGLLAVAGNHRHEILLLAKRPGARSLELIQSIAARGAFVRRAEFVRRGTERGLRLVERPEEGSKARAWVFDFAGRDLMGEKAAKEPWKQSPPPRRADWTVTPLPRKSGTIGGYEVLPADGEAVTVRLGANRVGTAFALLPPCKPLNVPLLAVGYLERGVAYLGLFEAVGGRQVRQFTGHLNAIHSLAFDAEGRLLASAAEDKTVCVWSLTDLGDTLGKKGMIWGLAVKQGKGGLRVAELDRPKLSKANQKAVDAHEVQRDDRIEKVEGLPPVALTSPHAFYEALWKRAPGTKVSLEVGGRKVPLEVDQGIDERKPLFSLFVTAGAKPAWLAWNPNGPYDTGPGDAAEDHMGWHLNPREPGGAVEFHKAAKYRKENRHAGIIQHLVARGNLAEALRDWKDERVPKPELSLDINELDPAVTDERGIPVVQDGRLTLNAGLYGVPLVKLKKVQWQFDGGQRHDFDEDDGRTRRADLGGLKWQRGVHELRLIVTTVEPVPVEHFQTIRVHYLPPPPSAAFAPAWLEKTFGTPLPKRLAVAKPTLGVEGAVTAARELPAGEQVEVELRHNGKAIPVTGMAIRQDVTLRPGINVLELFARNKKARTGLSFESTTERLEVYYDVPIKPTTVTVESIDPSPDAKVNLPTPGKTVVVRVPAVRVRVRVSAGEPLIAATLDGKPLAGFAPDGKLATFLFEGTVKLAPGEQKRTFAAQTRNGKPASQSLTIAYHPDLPGLEATERRSLDREAGAPLDFRLQLRLTDRKHADPFKAGVRVNGEKEEIPAELDEGERRVTARVRLRPGNNRLVLVLKNKYREHLEEVQVYSRRPPVVLPIPRPPTAKKPATTLTLRVRSAKDLPLLGVSVNGREVSADLRSMTQDRENPEVWTVVLKDLPLAPGNKRFDISARNRDGVSLEPAAVTVLYEEPKKPPRPARVEIDEPQRDVVVGEPRSRLVFRVFSESKPLVRVLRDGIALPLPDPRQEGDALVYRLDVLDLQPGPHTLRVEVGNAAGQLKQVPQRVVNYLPPWSVRIRLNRLERVDKPGTFLELTDVAPVAMVRLHGAVEWRQANDPSIRRPMRLRVWVNAFEQSDVKLGPVRENRRAFVVPLRLNRERNQVELQLPASLKVEANEPTRVSVACARPDTKQRLHLLVLGPGQRDQKKLSAAVLKAFLASNIDGKKFQTPAFDEGVLHIPPAGSKVSREEVESYLLGLKRKLRFSTDATGNVVVVFFSGVEAVENKKLYLLTETSRKLGRIPTTAIDCDVLRQILGDFGGAKLLLLDTKRLASVSAAAQLGNDSDSRHLGLYRYVWLGRNDAPEKARLVYALEQSLSSAPVLQEQKPILAKWARGLGEEASFDVDLLYPPESGLRLLRLGKERKE